MTLKSDALLIKSWRRWADRINLSNDALCTTSVCHRVDCFSAMSHVLVVESASASSPPSRAWRTKAASLACASSISSCIDTRSPAYNRPFVARSHARSEPERSLQIAYLCLASALPWCQSVGRRPTTLRRRGNGRATGAVAAGSSSPARAEPACQLSLTYLRHVCRSGGRSVGFSEATLGRRRRRAGFDGTANRIWRTSEMGYNCQGTMVLAIWTFFDDSESSLSGVFAPFASQSLHPALALTLPLRLVSPGKKQPLVARAPKARLRTSHPAWPP